MAEAIRRLKATDAVLLRASARDAALLKGGKRSAAYPAMSRRSAAVTRLDRIDNQVPGDLDVYLVLDNYGTHKTPLIHR